jgi:hypothetical protein
MQKTSDTFEELIAPVTPEHFFSDFWEKQFLHLEKGPGTFDHLFSIRDVDRWLLSTRGGPADSIALTAPEGASSAFQKYRPQEVAIDSVYEAFSGGRSVVLNYLESCWPPVMGLVKSLGHYFCADIGVNVYLTPQGKRTFDTHVDDHDVFILQVDGEKAWRLHELKFLSVMRLEHKQDLELPPEWGKGRLETPLAAELRLRPGDILYIPRGMPHCAVAEDTTSLHLTVSITPLYWTDLLKAAVEQASFSKPELRKALRPGFVQDPTAREGMRDDFAVAMQTFADSASYDSAFNVLRRSRLRQQGYPLDGHFAHLDPTREIVSASAIERRGEVLCFVDSSESGFCSIFFASRHIRGPERLRRSFEFVRDHARFTVDQIPGLDDNGKVVLVRRLIREGLLRFVDPQDLTAAR